MTEHDTLTARRARREHDRIREIVEDQLRHSFWTPERLAELDRRLPKVLSRELSPLEVAEALIERAEQMS